MGCNFKFSGNNIKVVYLYDEREMEKVNYIKCALGQ